MFLNPKFRQTKTGDDVQILNDLRYIDKSLYRSTLKKISDIECEGLDMGYMGEHIHDDILRLVFIRAPKKIVKFVESQLNKNHTHDNIKIKVSKIIFSHDTESPVCVLEDKKSEWLLPASTKEILDKTGKKIILENYPCEYTF
jgi:hypothetical protein